MSKHFNIYQNNSTSENLSNLSVVNKIYDMIIQDELTNNVFNNNSNFVGKINVPATYQEYIDKINDRNYFPDLIIIPSAIYIKFKDPMVEQVLLNAGIGDGTGITLGDAAAATSLPSFENNTDITSFDELIYFTKIKTLNNNTFRGCTNLTSINLINVTSLGENVFRNCSSLETADLTNCSNIGQFAFHYCDSLSHIEFSNSLSYVLNWGSICNCPNLGAGEHLYINMSRFGGECFQYTKYEKATIIGNVDCSNNGSVWPIFHGNTNIKYLDLSATSTLYVYQLYLSNNTVFETIIYPTSTNKISWAGFSDFNKDSFKHLIILATTPPTIESYDYLRLGSNAHIYVPDEVVDDYKNAWTGTIASGGILGDKVKPLSSSDLADITWYTKQS